MNEKVEKAHDRARKWWEETKDNRAAMATLRHCRKPVDVLFVPAGMNLVRRLPGCKFNHVAALAAILSHVRDDSGQKIARAIGHKSFGDENALLSEGRFRRLLQIDDAEELLISMVRLVRHLRGTANVADISESVIFWGDRMKQRWAFSYYAVQSAAPNPNKTSSTQ